MLSMFHIHLSQFLDKRPLYLYKFVMLIHAYVKAYVNELLWRQVGFELNDKNY